MLKVMHTESHGKPLGVEVHAMSYAYSRGTLIDNVVYYEYTIKNKSANTYNNFRVGQFADMDLGYPFDDFIGFDSTYRMAVTYNGTNDDGNSEGHPAGSYGMEIPIVGVTIVAMPGDVPGSYVPAGSFMSPDADVYSSGPAVDTYFNNNLRSESSDDTHLVNSTGADINYIFETNKSDSLPAECEINDNPGDRRSIIASNDFTLLSGGEQKIVMALVTKPLDTNNGCPTATFAGIITVADTAWANYYNPPPILATPALTANISITIHPNPAHDHLFIDDASTKAKTITVYNTLGQQMEVNISNQQNGFDVRVGALAPGVYYIKYSNGMTQKTFSFVKE